jgi:hypothetical protein
MREHLKSYILGRLTKIFTEQLTKNGPSYCETVAVPGESKASCALLLRSGKNGGKPIPKSGINI